MIAIDGGGTKTEFILFDDKGRVIKRKIAGGSNMNSLGSQTAFSVIKSGKFKRGNNIGGKQRYPKHLIEFSNASRKNHFHPTQKPVALLEYLIRTYTNEGETVLDFTMGSGSTGVACVNTNRNFIGIELDEGYFNIAKKRIEEAQAQSRIET